MSWTIGIDAVLVAVCVGFAVKYDDRLRIPRAMIAGAGLMMIATKIALGI